MQCEGGAIVNFVEQREAAEEDERVRLAKRHGRGNVGGVGGGGARGVHAEQTPFKHALHVGGRGKCADTGRGRFDALQRSSSARAFGVCASLLLRGLPFPPRSASQRGFPSRILLFFAVAGGRVSSHATSKLSSPPPV